MDKEDHGPLVDLVLDYKAEARGDVRRMTSEFVKEVEEALKAKALSEKEAKGLPSSVCALQRVIRGMEREIGM